MPTKTTLTLKLNPNNKIDSSKLNPSKSTPIVEIQVDKTSPKHNQTKAENPEIKPKKIPTPPAKKVMLNFQEIYNKLHNKFPNVINMANPVIFAIGIHKTLAKEVEISKQFIGKWLSWYVRKSKYYNNYQEGMKRYNLAGEQCGVVTEEEASYVSSKIVHNTKQKEKFQEKQQ